MIDFMKACAMTKLHILQLLLLLLMIGTIIGCNYAPPEPRYDNYVKDNEIFGVWKMSVDSINKVAGSGNKELLARSFTINLNSNGNCVFKSVENLEKCEYITCDGKWELLHDQAGPTSKIKKNVLSLSLNINNRLVRHVYGLGKENGEIFLWEYCLDPDEGFLIYTKETK